MGEARLMKSLSFYPGSQGNPPDKGYPNNKPIRGRNPLGQPLSGPALSRQPSNSQHNPLKGNLVIPRLELTPRVEYHFKCLLIVPDGQITPLKQGTTHNPELNLRGEP